MKREFLLQLIGSLEHFRDEPSLLRWVELNFDSLTAYFARFGVTLQAGAKSFVGIFKQDEGLRRYMDLVKALQDRGAGAARAKGRTGTRKNTKQPLLLKGGGEKVPSMLGMLKTGMIAAAVTIAAVRSAKVAAGAEATNIPGAVAAAAGSLIGGLVNVIPGAGQVGEAVSGMFGYMDPRKVTGIPSNFINADRLTHLAFVPHGKDEEAAEQAWRAYQHYTRDGDPQFHQWSETYQVIDPNDPYGNPMFVQPFASLENYGIELPATVARLEKNITDSREELDKLRESVKISTKGGESAESMARKAANALKGIFRFGENAQLQEPNLPTAQARIAALEAHIPSASIVAAHVRAEKNIYNVPGSVQGLYGVLPGHVGRELNETLITPIRVLAARIEGLSIYTVEVSDPEVKAIQKEAADILGKALALPAVRAQPAAYKEALTKFLRANFESALYQKLTRNLLFRIDEAEARLEININTRIINFHDRLRRQVEAQAGRRGVDMKQEKRWEIVDKLLSDMTTYQLVPNESLQEFAGRIVTMLAHPGGISYAKASHVQAYADRMQRTTLDTIGLIAFEILQIMVLGVAGISWALRHFPEQAAPAPALGTQDRKFITDVAAATAAAVASTLLENDRRGIGRSATPRGMLTNGSRGPRSRSTARARPAIANQ